jgi:U3 small nucleolar RNA-associated protein 21
MGYAITSLAISQDSVFAAAHNFVGRYVRGKEVGRMILSTSSTTSMDTDTDSDSDSDDSDSDEEEEESTTETLTNLIIFGTTLVALSVSGRKMFIWDIPPFVNPASKVATGESITTTPYATIDFEVGFTATQLVHPATYLNKIVVGSKEGRLAIWNIRTGFVSFVLFPFMDLIAMNFFSYKNPNSVLSFLFPPADL